MMPPLDKNSALFLDIDGTLLDLARTPEAVAVPDGLLASLKTLRVALGGAVAFVSGRSLAAIDGLFAPLVLPAIGCHGVEVRGAGGEMQTLAAPMSAPVREFMQNLAGSHPGTLLEDKIYTLALHYRLAPEAFPALEAAFKDHHALFETEKVTLQQGKAVIETKPLGIDKGVGVRALLRQPPFRGRVPVFGGDDTTDMDAFQILPELGGTSFSVGRRFDGVDYHFPSPLAVRQWLAQLAEQGISP
ncbi:MAG TPA: trehalose-phosphatase [Rhizomicrobium sp.]|nr:trehalose-phosphatase [Rhizomicrobium sp.]